MKSIAKHITPASLVARIRMERQKHKGAFLLMEGGTDVRRFEKFLQIDACVAINCFGKSNVTGAVDLMQDVGNGDCLGFVDADFDRIDGTHAENEDIIHSSSHDFDMDVCATEVMPRYMSEMCKAELLTSEGGCQAIVDSILLGIKPLSAMRYANVKHGLGYLLSRVDLKCFFDGQNLSIDKMIDSVSNGKFSAQPYKAALRTYIDRYTAINFDLWQFTNGHDFIEALGLALRSRIGARTDSQTWRSEVEKHLRLAIDVADFERIGIPGRIATWERARPGLVVLKKAA